MNCTLIKSVNKFISKN